MTRKHVTQEGQRDGIYRQELLEKTRKTRRGWGAGAGLKSFGGEWALLFEEHLEVHDDGAVGSDEHRVAVDGGDFRHFKHELLNLLERVCKGTDCLRRLVAVIVACIGSASLTCFSSPPRFSNCSLLGYF